MRTYIQDRVSTMTIEGRTVRFDHIHETAFGVPRQSSSMLPQMKFNGGFGTFTILQCFPVSLTVSI